MNATIVTALADRDQAIKHVLHSAFSLKPSSSSVNVTRLRSDRSIRRDTFACTTGPGSPNPPRRGYQWTRKVGQKTITVALSRDQYQALKQALDNARTLWKTVAEMERVSRQVLFEALPDTRRRKRLSKKVLGLI